MPVQSPPIPHPEKFYRPYPPPSSYSSPSAPALSHIDPARPLLNGEEPFAVSERAEQSREGNSDPTNGYPSEASNPPSPAADLTRKRHPRSLRFRTGRGGRLHLDRLLHTHRPHPLLRAERGGWPHSSNTADRHSEELEKSEEARWKDRDWRPKPGFSANLRRVTDGIEPGQNYWSHESVYGDTPTNSRKRKREEEEVIGFEQIGDGLGLPTDADWEMGSQWRLEPRSRGPYSRAKFRKTEGQMSIGHETLDYAWRIDERWRYDSDTVRGGEDRFLLDDFQPKWDSSLVSVSMKLIFL